MANYYNVTGWKHTGFNTKNRPFNREVLNQDYFVSEGNYIQMRGVALNRSDMAEISYIDLQGSVKDLRGTQVNAPNVTGTNGPGGPWYSWEEVDYIRLTRTGYPGDEDFVDISGNQKDPWNAPNDKKALYIGYYFVTGLEPRARNVTRIYLLFDAWTSLGGASELEIETGYKIRGHITEAEDAASYNLAPENISTIEPLEVKSHGYVRDVPVFTDNVNIVVSSIDLIQYDIGVDEIGAWIASAAGGQSIAIPQILTNNKECLIKLQTPMQDGSIDVRNLKIKDYGFFDADNEKVLHNLSILQSCGQVELQDAYSVPKDYIFGEIGRSDGQYTEIANSYSPDDCPVTPDIGSYPRKADYIFGEYVLYSCATGAMNAQKFYDVEDNTIITWAVLTPNGSPIARFRKIKNHAYIYDQSVQGMTWAKKAIVLQGASGSMWAQINNAFAQQTLNRAAAENDLRNRTQDQRYLSQELQLGVNAGIAAGRIASSTQSASNLLSGGRETWDAAQQLSNFAFDAANLYIEETAERKGREFTAQALQQEQNQINASIAQANFGAPYVNFVPDLNTAVFLPNAFGVYIINTTQRDRERLKRYFRRYGYNGLYQPLTWSNINVKQRVNYIQAEGVALKHHHYSMRVVAMAEQLLSEGIFLWNERPNNAAFDSNPDN